MTIGGIRPAVNIQTLVLPREGHEPLVFKAGAVTSMAEFEKLCPEPQPPTRTKKGGEKVANYEADSYKIAMEQYAANRVNFIVLKSLEATPDLKWDTVQFGDPSTWDNWRTDCANFGIAVFEVNRIVNTVFAANGLNSELIDAAKASFLAAQVETQE